MRSAKVMGCPGSGPLTLQRAPRRRGSVRAQLASGRNTRGDECLGPACERTVPDVRSPGRNALTNPRRYATCVVPLVPLQTLNRLDARPPRTTLLTLLSAKTKCLHTLAQGSLRERANGGAAAVYGDGGRPFTAQATVARILGGRIPGRAVRLHTSIADCRRERPDGPKSRGNYVNERPDPAVHATASIIPFVDEFTAFRRATGWLA